MIQQYDLPTVSKHLIWVCSLSPKETIRVPTQCSQPGTRGPRVSQDADAMALLSSLSLSLLRDTPKGEPGGYRAGHARPGRRG